MDSIKKKFLYDLIKECDSDVDRIIKAAKARYNYVFSREDVVAVLDSLRGDAAAGKTRV